MWLHKLLIGGSKVVIDVLFWLANFKNEVYFPPRWIILFLAGTRVTSRRCIPDSPVIPISNSDSPLIPKIAPFDWWNPLEKFWRQILSVNCLTYGQWLTVANPAHSALQEPHGGTDGVTGFWVSIGPVRYSQGWADCSGGISKVLTFPPAAFSLNSRIPAHHGLQGHSQELHGETDGTIGFYVSNRYSTRFPGLADCSGGISEEMSTPSFSILNFAIPVHSWLQGHSQESHGRMDVTIGFYVSK